VQEIIILVFKTINHQSNNSTRYYTIISNIPSDIKKCLKDNIDNINTENFHPKDDFLDRLITTKSLVCIYYFTEDIKVIISGFAKYKL
jgi:hypothetical protein